MKRLLSLRQAVLAMKQVTTHDGQRSKVRDGVKGLIDSGKAAAKTSESAPAPAKWVTGRRPCSPPNR